MATNETLQTALLAAQMEMPAAVINKTNPHFKNKYADLGAVREAAIPTLSKHGLVVTQTMGWAGERFALTTRITHAATGECIESLLPLPDEGKPQDIGSAITYMRRYGLATLAGLTSEEDDDGHTAGAVARPAAKANGNGADKDKGLTGKGITELKTGLRALSAELGQMETEAQLDELLTGARLMIRDCETRLPLWYHGDGADSQGLLKAIDNARAKIKNSGITPGTFAVSPVTVPKERAAGAAPF